MKIKNDMDQKSKSISSEKEKGVTKTLLKGIGLMGICCLLPIIITALLPLLSSLLGGAGTRVASIAASLACPIMMIGMLFMMSKGHGCCSKEKKDDLKQ